MDRQPTHRKYSSAFLATVLIAALFPSLGYTQNITGDFTINTERFRLAVDRSGMLDVENAAVPEHGIVDGGLWFGYSNDPLVVLAVDNGRETRIGSLVHDRVSAGLVGSVALFDFLQLGFELPLALSQGEERNQLNPATALSGTTLGELRLVPKLQLLKQAKHGFNAAFIAGVQLPLGAAGGYTSDNALAFFPELAISKRTGPIKLALNVGYNARQTRTLVDSRNSNVLLQIGSEAIARAAIGYRFDYGEGGGPPVEVDLALRVATKTDDFFGSPETNHGEVMAGLSYDVGNFVLFGAGGYGIAQGFGTPDYRVLGGLRGAVAIGGGAEKTIVRSDDYVLRRARKLEKPEEKPEEDVETDRDGDGIFDSMDDCPDEPEDDDGFEDEDGCPEPDNDGDGVLDVDDECIDEPGPLENGGCPLDDDRDGDGIIDSLDNCPDEPGTVEFKGCNEEQFVEIRDGKIEILDIVHFKTNKAVILSKSFGLLNNVAAVVKMHPEITLIEVEGHTDSRGRTNYNKMLSQQRADSVLVYLVEQEVSRKRLKAIGYGESRPVDSNETTEGRAANRRVEFTIVGDADQIPKASEDEDQGDRAEEEKSSEDRESDIE